MKIWFNRWFTTVLHFIEMIRENPDRRKVKIYGTHPNKDALYLQYCDFSYVEPDISGTEYIAYCLEFCKVHGIHIFVPHKENVLIAKHLDDFEAIGVKVLVSNDVHLMETLENKSAAYRMFSNNCLNGTKNFTIPEYYVVNNLEEFKKSYLMLREQGHMVCFKPVIGEGAKGFRVIKDEIETIDQLFNWSSGYRISYRNACEILSQQEYFPDLMVMEYLDGVEYSIDCLASSEQLFAAIPRMKGEGRVRELVESHELIQIAQQFYQQYKLPYVFNIQVKYKNNIPKLLEINPRMSGGMHISCLSGINIPYLAIKILLGEKIEYPKPQFGIRASYIEKELILKNGVRHHKKTI
ncbi:ATP-grasp domain-containing protein [Bacillus sp. BRMEA1]|uniref:ATP-grasp domain-containing protein n=1 Tax=Neobacillus endophyticus TaxID=2738405 RepID=UPI00156782D3|nr:ATP-grasp domain-containing protein [Neobacillus endophyticus]NRD79437.1 ATP-grasp domain-containing protein [Neobacillus endophyticus]